MFVEVPEMLTVNTKSARDALGVQIMCLNDGLSKVVLVRRNIEIKQYNGTSKFGKAGKLLYEL